MTWLKWQSFCGSWNNQALMVGFASELESRFSRYKIMCITSLRLLSSFSKILIFLIKKKLQNCWRCKWLPEIALSNPTYSKQGRFEHVTQGHAWVSSKCFQGWRPVRLSEQPAANALKPSGYSFATMTLEIQVYFTNIANTEMSMLKWFRTLNTTATLEQSVNWNVWRAVNLQYQSIRYSSLQIPDNRYVQRECWWISETVTIMEEPGPGL